MTGQSVTVATPDYIFAVTHADYVDQKFDELRGSRRIMYAYHGSRLENFHSILHYGLQGHLNKVRVFRNVDAVMAVDLLNELKIHIILCVFFLGHLYNNFSNFNKTMIDFA